MGDSRDIWEGGMRAGFGAGSPEPGESMLEAIERLSGTKARILLHDDESDASPVLRVGPQEVHDDSRYQIVGEVARGGVGVIYKARDRDLGRDVALKVLREDHAHRSDVFARFIEEAQIGAQLQHPGIAPVYGIGIQPDGRPHFAMKLIKGRTLAARLRDRASPRAERHQLLKVFEQVCQTMAYVHARRVIHRDLKPANILVGSFGEVQVVDWGFGKVLGRPEPARAEDEGRTRIATVRSGSEGSASLVGSVMGTPAYMPPEQALGHIDDVDQQSDVFALGAILCEILTGAPPYTGASKDLLVQASQGRLDDAHARLEEVDVAPELVLICKRALEPMRGDRYEDAGELARVVSDHLAAAEERARQAELDAIEERGRLAQERQHAAWERRAKRKVRGLAATVVLAVLVGGGLWLWQGMRDRERVENARPAFDASLEQATLLAGRKAWPEALAAARKAVALAADDEMRTRAGDLLASVNRDKADADATAAQLARDQQLLRTLGELRLLWHTENRGKYDSKFQQAFDAYGLDLRVDDAAQRITARGEAFAAEVVAALDDWIWLRKELLVRDDWEWIRTLADAATPGEEQKALRKAVLAYDKDALREIANQASHEQLGRRGQLALATALWNIVDPELAVTLLKRWRDQRPNDFWLHCLLGRIQDRRAPEEAKAAYTAALALRPTHVQLTVRLGIVCDNLKDREAAYAFFRRASQLDPDHAHARALLAVQLFRRERWEEAHEEACRAQALGDASNFGVLVAGRVLARRQAKEALPPPDTADAYTQLAMAHWDARRYEKALAAALRAVELDPGHAGAHLWLGTILSNRQRHDAAAAALIRATELDPDNPETHRSLSYTYLVAGRFKQSLQATRRAIELRPDSGEYVQNLAAPLQGLQRHEEALEGVRRNVRLAPFSPLAQLNLAIMLGDTGQYSESVRAAREAVRLSGHSTGRYFKRASAYWTLAHALNQEHSYAEAAEAAQEAVRLGQSAAGETLALALLNLGRLDEALEAATQARSPLAAPVKRIVALQGRLPAVLAGDEVPASPSEWARFGQLCFYTQRYAESVRLYRTAFERDAGLSKWGDTGIPHVRAALRAGGPHTQTARSFLERALDDLAKNRLSSHAFDVARMMVILKGDRDFSAVRSRPAWRSIWAKVDSLLAQAREPSRAPYHVALGRRLYASKQYAGAIPALRDAWRLDPEMSIYVVGMLARALYERYRYVESEAVFRKILERAPETVWAHNLLGNALLQQRRVGEAIEAFRSALKIREHSASYHNLARALHMRGHFEEAQQAETTALGREPTRAGYWVLATCLVRTDCAAALEAARKGNRPELVPLFERYLRLEPDLDAYRHGDKTPGDAMDAGALCQLCWYRGFWKDVIRFFREAVAPDSALEGECSRFAAEAALRLGLAAKDGTIDLDLVRQARTWFQQALEFQRTRVELDPVAVVWHLTNWPSGERAPTQTDAELARLPKDEAKKWRAFWQDLDKLLTQACEEAR